MSRYLSPESAHETVLSVVETLTVLSLEHLLPGPVVDLGSGEGTLLGAYKERFLHAACHGYDADGDLVETANASFPDCTFTQEDLTSTSFPDGSASIILASRIMDYTDSRLARSLKGKGFDASELAEEVERMLQPGGTYISLFDYASPAGFRELEQRGFTRVFERSLVQLYQKNG